MSAIGGKADVPVCAAHVCLTKADIATANLKQRRNAKATAQKTKAKNQCSAQNCENTPRNLVLRLLRSQQQCREGNDSEHE